MEFKKGIYQARKVRENDCGHEKVMEFHQYVMEFFNRRITVIVLRV